MLRALQLWPPSSGLPASITRNKKNYRPPETKQNKHPPNHPRFGRRTARSTACQLLPIPRIYDNHRTIHVFVSWPYQAQLADYFSLPEYVNQAAVIFNDLKITNQMSWARASSIIPPVFTRFSFKAQKSHHTSAEEGLVFTPRMKEPTQYLPKTERK